MVTPTSPRLITRKNADLRWMAEELVKAWKRIEEQDKLIASIRSFMAEKGDGGGG